MIWSVESVTMVGKGTSIWHHGTGEIKGGKENTLVSANRPGLTAAAACITFWIDLYKTGETTVYVALPSAPWLTRSLARSLVTFARTDREH